MRLGFHGFKMKGWVGMFQGPPSKAVSLSSVVEKVKKKKLDLVATVTIRLLSAQKCYVEALTKGCGKFLSTKCPKIVVSHSFFPSSTKGIRHFEYQVLILGSIG